MIRQATHTMNYMVRSNNTQSIHNRASGGVLYQADQSIPLDLLQAAKGLVFLTVIKAGMVVSGRIGTGLVIARHDDSSSGGGGWSAPCALATVGMGWGALIGGDVTHYLVVLTTEKAVQDLVSSKSIQLGAELGVAVGPLGRGAHGHVAVCIDKVSSV
jgi:lipid-binding SYLF domain-containing protein